MAVAAIEAQQPVSAQLPVTAQAVGNAFVEQYYVILHQSPELVHKFYQDISKLGRPDEDGSLSVTTTMQAINENIVSLNYGDLRVEIKSVDSQESINGAVQVLVTGNLTGKDNKVSHFVQSFFLAPQDRGYFVLNDMFRYVNGDAVTPAVTTDVVVPDTLEPVLNSVPVQENVSGQSTPSAEEVVAGEVYNPSENGHVPVTEEEIPVAEVVDEVQDNAEPTVETPAKVDVVTKKSYASIVMHLKKSAAIFSPRSVPPRKALPKSLDQVKPISAPTPDVLVSSSGSLDHEPNQDGEADGHSIYLKGLPMNATEALLEAVFSKFGTIKNDGIQVRSNRLQGFCFGFVEFEEASSVQKALEASPVEIGGRQAFVEEKRSTNSRGSNKGRFQSGRGSGFRNEGPRGRGGYGGGRGYNRGDFNGRGEFGNRGGNHGGSSYRDGFQRSENIRSNGRTNRAGGVVANGNAKNITPHVSATA